MGIDFPPGRWEQVRRTYNSWWAGELSRPIISAQIPTRNPGRPKPKAPLLTQASCADLSIPVDDLVDRIDWELSRYDYLGDAFPWLSLDCFGPGLAAAFMGAKLDNSTGRVWFHPPKNLPITELHFEYDPNNVWLRRAKELCIAMMQRWQGQVQVSMFDLGGALDILSTFRPSEELLLDLYDHPDHVARLVFEIHSLWHRYYEEINAVLQPVNPGYTAWCGIWSDLPYYILQCDFCYMISTDMFEQFVLPELKASTQRLGRCFYHLDGKGQLGHLDALLTLKNLAGVQWVPGAGAPQDARWPELYQRIFAAGKKAQIRGSPMPETYALLERIGLGPGVHYPVWSWTYSSEAELREWMEKFLTGDFTRKGRG